jgi:uncharacterized protein YjiS (DUF1127 family)
MIRTDLPRSLSSWMIERRQQRALMQLLSYDDHLLSDMGLTRSDVRLLLDAKSR